MAFPVSLEAQMSQSILQEFVKLAKWEDRGQYAQAMQAEKSQRQLHKMMRDSQEVYKRPAAGVIGTVSASIGSQKHLQEADDSTPNPNTDKKKKKSSKNNAPAATPLTWSEKVRILRQLPPPFIVQLSHHIWSCIYSLYVTLHNQSTGTDTTIIFVSTSYLIYKEHTNRQTLDDMWYQS